MGDRTRVRKGTLAGYDVFLAAWRDQPYMRLWREIQPDRVDIPGASGKIEGDPTVRSWIIDDWTGGSGYPIWEEGVAGFNDSNGLRPHPKDQGLALGAYSAQDGTAPSGQMRFGFHNSRMYAFDDVSSTSFKYWNPGTAAWVSTTSLTPTGTGEFRSVATTSDSTLGEYTWLATSNDEVVLWTGVNSWHIRVTNGNFYGIPRLISFASTLYAVDAFGLFVVDKSTDDTLTQVVDTVEGFFDENTPACFPVSSDVGIQWLQSIYDNRWFVHEYNHYTEAHSIIGQVPGRATSIFFYRGFTWVLYTPDTSDVAGADEYYLWFKGGGQEGSVGPLDASGQSDSYQVVIVGAFGDELILNIRGVLWAYNFTSGGYWRISTGTSFGVPNGWQGWLQWDGHVFISEDSAGVWRITPNAFDLSTGTWQTLDTGRFDFDYPGFDKIFTEVIIYTDTGDGDDGSLALEYSVDGGSFTAHADTKTISAANRKHTFTLSNTTTTVKGHELELRLKMKSDGTDAPIIRKVVARALPAEYSEEILLELDTAGPQGDGADPRSSEVLANLRTLAASGTVVSFLNPWEVEDFDSPETISVKVVQVALPSEGAESLEQGVAQVRLRVV